MHEALRLDVRKIYSVTEVTRDIRGLLNDNFSSLWLCGEVSNFKKSAAGHLYFTLKDSESQMSAVMFRGESRLLRFEIEDGMELIVHGRIDVYAPRGNYQIILDTAEPRGVGSLQLAFEQLKASLLAEGLFEAARKRPIPYLPEKIGIITSPKGAVLHDIMNVIGRRFPGMALVICPVKVQGEGAAAEIAEAIELMNQREDLGVLIVGRGGGSLEDLWAFNEEVLVRAVAASRLPIISAVGHETDYTLCDLAADLRAPTPSAAAELAVPQKSDLQAMLATLSGDLQSHHARFLNRLREKILFFRSRLKDPRRTLADLRQRVDDLAGRLTFAQKQRLKLLGSRCRELRASFPDPHQLLLQARTRLQGLDGQLQALSPMAPLSRGYAMVWKNGQMVREGGQTHIGDEMEIQFADGRVKVRVV